MTTTTARFITVKELGALTELDSIVTTGARVRWLGEFGILSGVARHFVKDPERAGFLTNEDNIFDAYVRISGTFESFLPVREVLGLIQRGEFVRD